MNALDKAAFFILLPDEVEIKNAEQLKAIVASQIKEGEPTTLSFAHCSGEFQTVALAPALTAALLEILRLVSSGRGFRMISVEEELTTQQAADLLNVSRPFLVKLLETKEIPFTKTGRHRRVRANDLFAYKEKRDATRSDALGDLSVTAAEDGLI
ncbi:helix-turn-helix domain-containing protein [Primorskyibacter flagellatus]|uniref:DNA binding domain-containing protein, excisionase family n=1 Tax=Primorskyibacter flagellatus TaxID=1387277 RepID=A0A1W2CAX7_9RHOB|nr:helix-turn-helix domain-containing protein [Primorskyibacter flagellatus]SMC82124.1 DNA binding domain-containing protein, excisionase family [Primorskyibacter flagellatus]